MAKSKGGPFNRGVGHVPMPQQNTGEVVMQAGTSGAIPNPRAFQQGRKPSLVSKLVNEGLS